jgi:hypothetical protein
MSTSGTTVNNKKKRNINSTRGIRKPSPSKSKKPNKDTESLTLYDCLLCSDTKYFCFPASFDWGNQGVSNINSLIINGNKKLNVFPCTMCKDNE